MPKQAGDLNGDERREFEERDIAGERGGDTGNSAYVDDGPQAEKGDARREKPVQSEKAKNKESSR
jgi:hypothetical protein